MFGKPTDPGNGKAAPQKRAAADIARIEGGGLVHVIVTSLMDDKSVLENLTAEDGILAHTLPDTRGGYGSANFEIADERSRSPAGYPAQPASEQKEETKWP